MDLIVHGGVEGRFYGHDGGQMRQAVANPGLAMAVVDAAVRVPAAEEGSADAAGGAVVDADDRFVDEVATCCAGHVVAPRGLLEADRIRRRWFGTRQPSAIILP